MTRDEAIAAIKENCGNRNLMKHMLATEAVMVGLAERLGEDVPSWALAGPGNTTLKPADPALGRFVVASAQGAALLLDTTSGQTWTFARSATGSEAAWLPMRRMPSWIRFRSLCSMS